MSYRGKVASGSKNPLSPSNGIGFFDHFPKNFIRPYGGTEELITEESVNKRVRFYNCEMLKRPRIAMSELAQTTKETVECLAKIRKPILPASALKEIKTSLKPFNDALAPLRIKEGSSQANEKTVKAAVRLFLEPNKTLDTVMNKMYVTACNMLTLSTQYLINKTLLTNPQMFAEKVHATEVPDKEFKNGGDIKAMQKFLISACTAGKKKTTGSATKSLLEAFDSSSEEEEAKGEQQCDECDESSSEDSSDSSSEESENAAEEESEKSCNDAASSKHIEKIQSEEATEEPQLPLRSVRSGKRGKKRRGEEAAEDFQPLPNEEPANDDVVEVEEVQPPKKKKL